MTIQCWPSVGFFIVFFHGASFGQAPGPVAWNSRAEAVEGNQVVITMTANLAPGWHLYSQFLAPGGPTPTHFLFEKTDDYALLEKTEEKGIPVKYHDEDYEMDITWYSGTVSFRQKIMLNPPKATIHIVAEYLTCNDSTCIPCKQEFNIVAQSPGKTP